MAGSSLLATDAEQNEKRPIIRHVPPPKQPYDPRKPNDYMAIRRRILGIPAVLPPKEEPPKVMATSADADLEYDEDLDGEPLVLPYNDG